MRITAATESSLLAVLPHNLNRQHSRQIDALAYSLEFESLLLQKIALFQSTLDYVSSQIVSSKLRRELTRHEHNILAMANMAYERGSNFDLSKSERVSVASAFLISGMRQALMVILPDSHLSDSAYSGRIDQIMKRLGSAFGEIRSYREFLNWYDNQNLNDFIDTSSGQELKLRAGNEARKLFYLCQLSVYTSTPRDPDDYPLTIRVSPQELFSLEKIWTKYPILWSRQAQITHSGKIIISKINDEPDSGFRKSLGLLAELHLSIASKLISQYGF